MSLKSGDLYKKVFEMPLIQASKEGDAEAISQILHNNPEEKIDINFMEDGFSALFVASRMGRLDAVKILLTEHADANQKSWEGESPLHTALVSGHEDVAEALIYFDASPGKICDVWGTKMSPFQLAAQHGMVKLIKPLIEKGVDPNEVVKENGKAPLHLACRNNQLEFVKEMIKIKADINVPDHKGHTPLHIAALTAASDANEYHCPAAYHEESRAFEILGILLDAGADPRIPNQDGKTPVEMFYILFSILEKLASPVIKMRENLQEEKQDVLLNPPENIEGRKKPRISWALTKFSCRSKNDREVLPEEKRGFEI